MITTPFTCPSTDPWFDPWTARLVNVYGRVLGRWRIPLSPPYALRYRADVRVVLDRIEFLDYDGIVRATWDCKKWEVLGGDTYQLNVTHYDYR